MGHVGLLDCAQSILFAGCPLGPRSSFRSFSSQGISLDRSVGG